MMLEINGKTISIDFAHLFSRSGQLHIGFSDTRRISEIARDFESSPILQRISEEEGDQTYVGYQKIVRISRGDAGKDTYVIVLEKEV